MAAFYTSYGVIPPGSNDTTTIEFPYTCAQETCNGGGPTGKGEEYNSNSDIAYATMAYIKLLEYTQGTPLASKAERREWSLALQSLPAVPTAVDGASGAVVFAEATTRGTQQPPADTNAAYSITHLAIISPSQVYTAFSNATSPAMLSIAQNTVDMINRQTHFAPGNGFCLNWPASARVHSNKKKSHALLMNFSNAYAVKVKPNGWPDLR